MSEPLERNQVIELLDKLGSEQDEDVLAAARTLHSQVIQSGMGWEDLLVGDEPDHEDDEDDEDDEQFDAVSGEDEDYNDEYDDEEDEEDDTEEPDAEFSGDEKRTLGLIEKLLARDGISAELREELDEYKKEIADGDFQSSDHRYVHSLYARLTKK